MTELPKAFLKHRLFVPESVVTDEDCDQFTYEVPAYESQDLVTIRTYKSFIGYVGFARGDLGKLERIFGDRVDIQDERASVPHGFKDLRFTAKLRPDQEAVWDQWRKGQYGLIKAGPRFGKTVVCIYMLTKLKQRTIVLAHESGILQQFEDSMRKFTNINGLEEEAGVPLCGQLRNYDDVFPILTCSTWQMLNQPGAKDALVANRDAFGLMFIDEAHACAAPCFSRIVSNFNPRYRVPVTATEKRKDGYDVVVSDVAGPVMAEGSTEQLSVEVSIVWTGHTIKGFGNWNDLLSQLTEDPERNDLIVEWILKDAGDGHSVLVITDRRAHAKALEGLLAAADPDLGVDILIGGSPKTAIRDRARSGATQVVIASPKIVQLGWDVVKWSSIHNTLPMNNEQNYLQRVSRVRTPCEGCPGPQDPRCGTQCEKKRPVARIFADPGHGVTHSCLNTMNKVHRKLGFEVVNIPAKSKSSATTRAKSWKEVG